MEFLDASGKVVRSFTSAQDPKVARDSVRADSVTRARNDSIRRAGGTPDTTRRAEAPAEGGGGRRGGGAPPRVSNRAGLNTFAWNLRHPDASTFDNLIMWSAGVQGPVAIPGAYSVRMKVGGDTQASSFRVVKDPRSRATQAELQDQFAFLMRVRDETSKANDAVKLVRHVRSEIDDRVSKLPEAQRSAFRAKAAALDSALSAAEREIYQVRNESNQDPLNYPIRLNNKIAALAGVASSTDARPTNQTLEVFRILSGQLDVQVGRIRSALDRSLSSINSDLRGANLPPISTALPRD